jgi:hypothetical protein
MTARSLSFDILAFARPLRLGDFASSPIHAGWPNRPSSGWVAQRQDDLAMRPQSVSGRNMDETRGMLIASRVINATRRLFRGYSSAAIG